MKRTLILAILMLFLMSGLSYGRVEANWSCLYFDRCESDGGNKSTTTTPSLGQMVSEAGVYFLRAGRDYQDFLQVVEQAEYSAVDDGNLINSLDNALKNMEEANTRYYEIWKKSISLAGVPRVKELLAVFDYAAFQKKNDLIPGIFAAVESYLKPGNVPGIYEKTYVDTALLAQKLDLLKANLEGNNLDLPLSWEIDQLLFKDLLFGLYVSQVFFEIQKTL